MPNQPTIAEIRDRLVKEPLVRTFTIQRDGVTNDPDTRTVNLAFASDKPIQQFSWELWDYMELSLSMKSGSMRTERLKSGAPLLMDHDTRDVVGVIESFSIDKDGMARADVRFGKGTRASEVYQDVVDGIRQNVSVGFMVHEMHLEKERKGQPNLYRSDDWEPYEVSIVSVPADISVGVGRSIEPPAIQVSDDQQRSISTDTEKTMSDKNDSTPVTPAVDTRTAEQIAREAVRTEIRETAQVLGMADAEQKFYQKRLLEQIDADPTVAEFKAFVRSQIPPSIQVPVQDPVTAARMGGGGQEIELARTLPRHSAVTSFKGENAVQRAYRFGQWLLGRALYDPNFAACKAARQYCDEHGLTRAMGEAVNETGGYTVLPEFSSDLIDLREQYGVFRRNSRVVAMGSDTLTIPRRTSGLTPYFVAEAGSITASDAGWDQVTLVAKKLAVLARYSSEVNEDSIIDFANTLAGEIAYAFANKEDECGFNGDGTSTYGGIVGVREALKNLSGTIANISGLQVGTGNLYSELVLADFEGVVARLPQYADSDSAKWFVHRSFYWNVMVKAMLAVGGVTAAEVEDARKQRFMGYAVEFTQVMPKAEGNSQVCALLGDLSKASTMGTRRETQIAFSEHSRFANDQIEIRGTERFDINVHDVGDANATVASQVPGPVVGLITAAS